MGADLRLAGPTEKAAQTIITTAERKGTVTLDRSEGAYILAAAALSLAQLPAPVTEVAIRAGILPRVDLGFRSNGSAYRGEVFGQIYDSERFQLVAGAGGTYHRFDGGIAGALDQFNLLSVSEVDIDAVVLAGREWKYGSIYGGPKVVFSKYTAWGGLTGANSFNVSLLGGQFSSALPLGLNVSQSWLVGGTIGGRVGYKYLWVMVELGVYQSIYNPAILGQTVHLSGLVLFPMGGLAATF